MSPELSLVAACCRWPDDDTRRKAIRLALNDMLSWGEVERLTAYHRVEGLVWHGLQTVRESVPKICMVRLESAAQSIRSSALRDLGESFRVSRALKAAGLDHRFLKGSALGFLAYGTPSIKRSWDIDLLVLPGDAVSAAICLERLGYKPILPPRSLDPEEFSRWSVVSKEAEFRSDRGATVELHWRLADHPQLLSTLDARSPAREVKLLEEEYVLTLGDAENLAYLAVHGSAHAWFRLKWLADFNAFMNGFDKTHLASLLKSAASMGVGNALDTALALVADVFGEQTSYDNDRPSNLVAISRRAINASDEEIAARISSQARWRLITSVGYLLAELQLRLRGTLDRLEYPLPGRWAHLYPWLRIPFWIKRKTNFLAPWKNGWRL